MEERYSVLAKYYDKFTQNDCDYVSWSQYLYAVATKHGAKEVVDVACGTGKMTELLLERGLKVIGVDASEEMLTVARSKCKTTFVKQDMKKLSLPHEADMAVCVNDGVNYLKPSDLAAFFQCVATSLKRGAPFVFDVSSPHKLRNVIGNNVFYLDGEGETLLWSNTLAKNFVEMNLTLFVDDGNGKYARFDEKHTQYVHGDFQIEAALASAGFELCEITADYGKRVNDNSLRRCYYAVKR